MSGHVTDHCNTPKITRHWKRLGAGAVWLCTCDKAYRLTTYGSMDGPQWSWDGVDE